MILGFTFFPVVIESRTVPLGTTFAVPVVLFGLIWGRKNMGQKPSVSFFFISYLIATLFFIGSGIYWKGFPEFIQVGLL